MNLTEPGRRFDQRVEYRLEIESRTADNFEHISSSGLVLQRLSKLIEQPRVFHRDNRLVGKCLNQLDLSVCKRPRLPALQGEHTDDSFFSYERNG